MLKSSFGMIACINRDTTLASWASDIEGEESVCRRIRVQILKGINIERNCTVGVTTKIVRQPHLNPIPLI